MMGMVQVSHQSQTVHAIHVLALVMLRERGKRFLAWHRRRHEVIWGMGAWGEGPWGQQGPHGPNRPHDPAMPHTRILASCVLWRIDICTQRSKRGDSKSLCMRELEKSAASCYNNDHWNEKKKLNHNSNNYYYTITDWLSEGSAHYFPT